jgi:hypothetical protein
MISRIATATLLSIVMQCGWAQAIDAADAARAFGERQALCDRDKSALWGVDLCGPLFFVDAATRYLVANQNTADGSLQQQGDVYVGQLLDSVGIANTAVEWKGEHWSMVTWPLPQQSATRGALMIHESWHRIQDDLGLPPRSPTEAHLATTFGRTMMRMEWRALGAALKAHGDVERAQAIRAALIFRDARREEAQGAADLENQLELNEGLAEYTGRRLSGQDSLALVAMLDKAEAGSSFARSFAYTSGPAYGYLLDFYSSNWRKHVTQQSDLGSMLRSVAGIVLPPNIAAQATLAGREYGLTQVDNEERAAALTRTKQAKAWTLQLVRRPVLHLPFDNMQFTFDVNNLFPLPPYGTVYPTMQIIDTWGALTVNGGALLDNNWSGVTVAAPSLARLTGTGWSLKLNPGWAMRPDKRKGDVVIAKAGYSVMSGSERSDRVR